ncbi:unnamed protein product [Sphenostylis stenocarpa]|uniref:Uncharacterized protein n=1 Tax=Sphenostylis stenocarpa TaxID=92480 RepID=A0AA86SI96_9FABA|nr:unnamed protein product [Sphenostylis stenocarpa]
MESPSKKLIPKGSVTFRVHFRPGHSYDLHGGAPSFKTNFTSDLTTPERASDHPPKKGSISSLFQSLNARSHKDSSKTFDVEQKQQCVERHQPNKANRNIRGKEKATSFSVYH